MDSSTGVPRAALRAQLLGRVQIAIGDIPIPDEAWPRRTVRSLLLLLLATPGHRLQRDTVLELLWPNASPETATKSFYVAVHGLRRLLEPDIRSGRASSFVDVAGDMVALSAGAVESVDVEVFEAELRASGGDRRQHLAAALSLYNGDLLADDPYLDWPAVRREHLRWAWREAVLEYAALERASGRPLLAIPAIERVIQSDPTDETAYRILMSALAAAGRREDALRQYDRCRTILRDELGVEPGDEIEALVVEIRAAPAAHVAPLTASTRIDNLPAPPNPLVGRGREVEDLLDLVCRTEVRLVTVTGPGGVGKTRLALEAASLATDEFEDGVCFVSLAPMQDPSLVLPGVIRALGLDDSGDGQPLSLLQDAVKDRNLLLVLDNFEHLLDAASDVAELLAACHKLTVLVTSREPLHLRSEHDLPLLPLPVPDPNRVVTAGGVVRYSAVELFLQRATAVNRHFTLTDANAPAVSALCARLEGLPLAIELAAARARHLSPEELVAGLNDRFTLLADGYRDLPPRQRTMRAAIAWSYDLLDPEEQALFRKLSVFTGGVAPEAAAHVSQASSSGVLAALTDKALLRLEDGPTGARYGMFETIREFGIEQLAANHETAATERAHTAWFVTLAETTKPHLTGSDQEQWLELLDSEHANFRAVLERELRDPAGVENALRLGGAMWRFWWSRGYAREGRAWLHQALAIETPVDPAIRARALHAAGELAEVIGDYEEAERRYDEALPLRRALGDDLGVAEILNALGTAVRSRGDLDRAEALHQQALPVVQRSGDRRVLASTFNSLGAVAYLRGDVQRADQFWQEALTTVRELGDLTGISNVLGNLGALALMQNDPQRSIALQQEALVLARRIGDATGITRGLLNLAGAHYEIGQYDDSKAQFQEALGRARDTGDAMSESIILYDLGKLAEHERNLPSAATFFSESLDLFWTARNLPGAAACLERIGIVESAGERAEQSVRLLAAAESIRLATGASRDAVDHGDFERDQAIIRTRLGDTVFNAAWSAGLLLSPEQAVAEARAFVSRGVADL